jgi:hypothetical protein
MIELNVTVLEPGDPDPFDEPEVTYRGIIEWGEGHPMRSATGPDETDEQRAMRAEAMRPVREAADALMAGSRPGQRFIVRRHVPAPGPRTDALPAGTDMVLLARTLAEGEALRRQHAGKLLFEAMQVVSLTETHDVLGTALRPGRVHVAPGAPWGMPVRYRKVLAQLASNVTERHFYMRGGKLVEEMVGPHVNFVGATLADPETKVPLDTVLAAYREIPA